MRSNVCRGLFQLGMVSVVLSFCTAVQGQMFQHVIGTQLEERSEWVAQTADGGHVVAGVRPGDPARALVMKLDGSGVVQWETLLGGSGPDIANRVLQTSDGGYVVAGETGSAGAAFGIALYKLDATGTLLWQRAFRGTAFAGGSGGGTALAQTADGGFVLAGRLQGTGNAQEAPVLIRTNANGALLWAWYYVDLTFGVDAFASFYDVHQTENGGFIAAGFTAEGVTGEQQSLLVRTDPNGVPIWAKTYGPNGFDDCAYGCDPAANGEFLMSGFNKELGEGGGTYLLRTSPAGVLLWYRTFRFFNGNNSMLEVAGGDVLLAGNANDFSTIDDAAILQTDANGVFQWCMAYGGVAQQFGECALPAPGGYRVVGWTNSFGAGSFDIYSIWTDGAGMSGCNEVPFTPVQGEDFPPVEDIELEPIPLQEVADLPLQQVFRDPVREVLCEDPPCPPEDLVLDLTTGVDEDGNLIAVGDPDDDWDVTADPDPNTVEPRDAGVIAPNAAWLTIPGSRWISGAYQGPSGDYTYEFCFCLDPRFQDVFLSLDLRADDSAAVFVNGNFLGSTPDPSFNTPNPTHVETNDASLFQAGENCVEVVVSNSGGIVTGLNLAGFVEAVDGRCCEEDPCVTPPGGMVAWWPLDEPAAAAMAADIVNGNDGTYVNGAAPGAVGMVSNAVEFDGVDDRIRVPNHPTLNFGPATANADFSIDAWFYQDQLTTLYAPLVEKRDSMGRGYLFFLLDGNPALYMGDGGAAPGYTIYCCSGPFMTPGQWYHIAVTVDRNDPNGIQFYVDGLPAGAPYDPTGRAGSLANQANLLLGATYYDEIPGTPPHHFDGRIDEVEVFRRELTAVEVQSLYDAGAGGKCKERCHVPWDRRFCLNQNTVTTTVTLCNYTTSTHDYQLSFQALPAGYMPGCNINGPTNISVVGPNPVTVPAGQCVPVQIQIQRPAGMNAAYQIGCYRVSVTNVDTGGTFECVGSVVDRRDLCVVLTPIDVDVVLVSVLRPRMLNWEITNTSGADLLFDYAVRVFGEEMMPDTQVISLDGLPPGEPALGTLSIPDGQTVVLGVEAEAQAFERFSFFDVVLETDVDGDGDGEPLTSVALRTVRYRPGDMDCDGDVDFDDINAFVLALSGQAAYEAQYPDCNWWNADANNDGAVDFDDINPFVSLIGT